MKRFETISLRFAKEKPISSGVNSGSGDPPVRIIPEIIMKPSPEWRAVAASCWGSPQWAPARWDMWDSWDGLGRGVMLLLVSSGVGLWLLGAEPLAVCCGEGGVGACAAFEFADPGRVGVQVVGGLGGG